MAASLIHATCIALCGRGVLIRGPSGSGKSDLALRCLALTPSQLMTLPAELVADDQVLVDLRDGRLLASPPSTIQGLIEIRGIGIVAVPFAASAEIVMVAELVDHDAALERLPDPVPVAKILDVALPVLRLKAFEASAPVKLLVALAQHRGADRG